MKNRLLRFIRKYESFTFLTLLVLIAEITFIRSNILEFGRLDDFTGLFNSRTHTLTVGMSHGWFQAGRFIPAAMGPLLFNMTKSVSDLLYLRLISTAFLGLGGGLLALFVWRLFKRENFVSFLAAILVGVISITTTSAPSAATWATLAGQMPTLPLALIGGIVGTTNRKYLHLPWWIVSTGFILLSAFCYQQYAPLAVLPVCMWAAIQYVTNEEIRWKRIALVLLQTVGALGLNALYVFTFGDGAQDRVLRGSISTRIHWFIGSYIPRTIDIFIPNNRSSKLFSVLILLVLLIIPVLVNRRYIAFVFAAVLSWAACVAVALPAELWASYRLIHPAQIALWGGIAFGLVFVAKSLNLRFLIVAGLIAGLLAIWQADYRAYNFVAKPNHYDWESTKCQIRRNPEVNTFVVNEWNVSNSPVYSYDEYGAIASNFDWVLTGSIRMARLEMNANMNMESQLLNPILISKSDSAGLPDGTFLVIDQKMCK